CSCLTRSVILKRVPPRIECQTGARADFAASPAPGTGAPHMPFCSTEEAIAEIRAGRMVVLVDDESRENEGDLCMAAEKVTPEAINLMAKQGRGLICLSLTAETCDRLRLPLQTENNTTPFGTAFTVSIDGRDGVSTGISAADRAKTILTAVGDDCQP